MGIKPIVDFKQFSDLDIRVGRILKVEDSLARKPTYRLTIDFGPEIGTRVSCGAFRNYPKDNLIGKQIVAILNFGDKKMGPEISQALVLGVANDAGETIYLMPQVEVALGVSVF